MLIESWEDGITRQQKKGEKKLSGESLGFNCIKEEVSIANKHEIRGESCAGESGSTYQS